MSMDSDINSLLNQMHKQDIKGKGTTGELAVLKICESIYEREGGILYHSYEYKVDTDLPGNIKREGNSLYIENLGDVTEIDVLLVTPYRVFPIEVKSYRANTITLTDSAIDGCNANHKSPVHQNEMHCRHLYSGIAKSLPDGSTDYIIPIVCFVDECTVIDNRSDWQKEYIFVTILNNLKSEIIKHDVPGQYKLNLTTLDQSLKDLSTNHSKYYPVRI